jgi:hypothetical protein
MSKIVIPIILIAMLCSIACARMPQVGDHVSINSGFQSDSEGTITDIGNGLICLHQVGTYGEGDMCIGIGSIRMLTWKE